MLGDRIEVDPMSDAAAPLHAVSRSARTRERLLDAAFDSFAQEGFAASSVEAISERAGFSRGAFYYNFSSKEELFLALIERSLDRRLGTLDQEATITSFFEGLGGDDDRLLDLMRVQGEEDDLKWVMVVTEFRLHTIRGRDTEVMQRFDRLFATVTDELAARFSERAEAAGATLAVPAGALASIVVGVYIDAVMQAAVSQLDAAAGKRLMAERVVAVLRGLVREP